VSGRGTSMAGFRDTTRNERTSAHKG
jgi:hypothetical protein